MSSFSMDQFLIGFDRALRVVSGQAKANRPSPALTITDAAGKATTSAGGDGVTISHSKDEKGAAPQSFTITGAGKDGAIADTLARAYFANGKVDDAIKTEERAISLAKGTPLEKDESLAKSLEEFKAAKK